MADVIGIVSAVVFSASMLAGLVTFIPFHRDFSAAQEAGRNVWGNPGTRRWFMVFAVCVVLAMLSVVVGVTWGGWPTMSG